MTNKSDRVPGQSKKNPDVSNLLKIALIVRIVRNLTDIVEYVIDMFH